MNILNYWIMSDSVEDLVKKYKESIFYGRHPRSIGLFTIPEYPQYESERGMWSAALDAILTTLRYLAPATLLTLFWGQQSFFFRILKHIDSAFRAIVFSSEEQKRSVLEWLAEAGPVRVESLDTVWKHGWIVCGVLDAALPGACAGHPPTRLSMKHAQAIADHYLGVEPVFSRQELESNDALSKHQEWKLATYLDRIRQALGKLTPPVSKPTSQRTSPESKQFTLDYVAKGSGLTAAQINTKMYFKIYPTAQQAIDPGEITILIRGPKDTYGMTVLPPILGKAQLIRQKLLGLQSKQNFTESALPITQGAAYLRNYGKNDMNKTYFIPKTRYDIEIDAEHKSDHTKVSYKVYLEGRYEIYLTSRGQNIVGSPFSVTASKDITDILEKDSFCLEDGEEIDIVDIKTDRKVVLRIVDFVTEKMLLKENGTLEKISDDEAKFLMSSTENDRLAQTCKSCNTPVVLEKQHLKQGKTNKFNKLANKIIIMNRVCKVFNDFIEEKIFQTSLSAFTRSNKQYIPDIVNSTFNDSVINPFIKTEKVDKFIVPEKISVSICTEKSKSYNDEIIDAISTNYDDERFSKLKVNEAELSHSSSPDSLDKSTPHSDLIEQGSIDRSTPLSVTNPFLNDIYEENFNIQKDLRTYTTSANETNNSQHEEIPDTSIKIIIQPSDSLPSPSKKNPFIDENFIELERPKSPVFKIISGEVSERDDSIYIETRNELISEEMLGNEFINPFFVHHHPNAHEKLPIADFIIGAPVSLPPIIRVPSPEPITDQMRSLSITPEKMRNERTNLFDLKNINENKETLCDIPRPDFLSSNTLGVPQYSTMTDNLSVSSTFHSLESTETMDQSNGSNASEQQYELYNLEPSDRNSSARKDMWDSAYVSIDENNTSPDTNNNDNTALCEAINKSSSSPNDNKYGLKQEEITNMGPAEREIWETCNELNDNVIDEDIKPSRWDFKRPTFTPIIEENDRSMSSGTKEGTNSETLKNSETDTVTVAFAELNDIYQEYFAKSEFISTIPTTTMTINSNDLQTINVEDKNEVHHTSVNSASENVADVKRHAKELEGAISEVQADVTESVSVSPTLQNEIIEQKNKYTQNKNEIQFSHNRSNIVLEKKKYWDEKIMQLEAKSKEAAALQRKRPASKQLKHDSLTKRKGKQIVKNLLNAGNYNQTMPVKSNTAKDMETSQAAAETKLQQPITRLTVIEQEKTDEKLVEKWKKYWDERLEIVNTDPVSRSPETENIKIGSPTSTKKQSDKLSETKQEKDIKVDVINSNHKISENTSKMSPLQIKQELLKQIKLEVNCTDKTKNTECTPLAYQTRVQHINQATNRGGENETPKKDIKSIRADISDEFKEIKFKPSPLPIKQEIPEEVYRAFETSPKRFFGTSRKHILSKIDTFLGKPNVEHKTSVDIDDTNQDSGLVSSRISLFLNLTNTEELPWARKKSQSLNNIHQRKDSAKNGTTTGLKYCKLSLAPSVYDKSENNKNNELNKPNEATVKNSSIIAEDEIRSEKNLPQNKKPQKLNNLSSMDEITFTKAKKAIKEDNNLTSVQNQVSNLDQKLPQEIKHNKNELLRRISISKSEMDIFNKMPNEPVDDYPDRYKSCDELPKINVKSFISLYESASRTSIDAKPMKRMYRTSSMDSQKCSKAISTTSDAAKSLRATSQSIIRPSSTNSDWSELRYQSPKKLTLSKRSDALSSIDTEDSIDIKVVKDQGIETTYVCLSDIELEIVESSPDQSVESSPEKTTVAAHIEYKNRFKSAKEYFQSLEELREIKKPRKLNECEMLLRKQSTESLNDDKPQKRVKKKVKSRSLPSSEISKIWNQLQESQKEGTPTKHVKISEKFNVDDLFTDVMEGRLSRQGSLRGIPHKKAVLEAFRSMENISDKKLTSYELTVSELNDFAKNDQVKNAQTYLSEYPYLPTTDPSKYHSRLDTKASGLISFKELLETKPRRNSVPDLRLNPKFTVDL